MIRKSILKIKDNLRMLGLDLETTKTECVEFSNIDSNSYSKRHVKIGNESIEIKMDAKFLGLTLSNMKFENQCEIIREKSRKAYNLLHYTCGIYRGLEVNTALLLYKIYVRSVIEYGNFLYIPSQISKNIKIERLQFAGIRKALGYRCSIPTNVMVREAKMSSLVQRSIYLAKNFIIKNLMYGGAKFGERLTEYARLEERAIRKNRLRIPCLLTTAWNQIKNNREQFGYKKKHEVFSLNYWSLTRELNVNLEIGKKRGEHELDEMKDCIRETFNLCNNPIFMYTDGSKTGKGISTGIGYFIENWEVEKSISLHNTYSVATAEIVAILSALEEILSRENDKDKDIVILTDSKAAIKAIGNNSISAHRNEYAVEVRKKITEVDKSDNDGRKVVISWIPAHTGVEDNEKTDQLARKGTEITCSEKFKTPRAN